MLTARDAKIYLVSIRQTQNSGSGGICSTATYGLLYILEGDILHASDVYRVGDTHVEQIFNTKINRNLHHALHLMVTAPRIRQGTRNLIVIADVDSQNRCMRDTYCMLRYRLCTLSSGVSMTCK